MTLTAGTRLATYEIVAPIGAGGMGEVYRARDTKLHRDVAIKTLPELFAADPDRLARFEREAQSLAALNHPNIAQVYGVIEQPPALAMELVEGRSLDEIIAGSGSPGLSQSGGASGSERWQAAGVGPRGISIDDALPIARQIAEALEAAHERGIIHRDLKPANIKVRADGTVKVLDFGLAKMAIDSGAMNSGASNSDSLNSPTFTTPAMTQMGVILGTAAYMSPEQARGKPVDRRADIWAFGVILFEMLSGRRPFGGETMTDTLSQIVSREPDWTTLPEEAKRSAGALLRRCLERDPRKRLQSIGEARIALETPAAATSASDAIARRGVGLRLVSLLVLGALALGAAAAWVLRGRTQPQPQASAVRMSLPIAPAEDLIGAFVLSPDGSQLAFVGQLAGKNQVFVRRMDRDEATVLPGTEGASLAGPMFSPDGRWVVFTAGGTVKKAPVDGGPVVVLSQVVAGTNSRPAWGPDDTIVFANLERGLSAIPVAGGQARVLTTPDIKGAEMAHEMPWFLPDGKTLLYNVRISSGSVSSGSTRVVAMTLATGERRPLFPGVVLGFVGDNELIVERDGSVVSIPFDPARLTATGEPSAPIAGAPSAQRIMFSMISQFTVARNGTMVFLPAGAAERDRPMLIADRSGASTRVSLPTHLYADPRVSPDGQRIAVHVFEEGRDNWVVDLKRGAFTRLTFDGGEDETPVWSPDGRSIYWTSTRSGVNRGIYRKASDGSGAEQLIWSGDAHVHLGNLTPDGATLVISMIKGQHVHLASINVADGKLTPLLTTPFGNDTPALSHDGRWIAYESNESGQAEVYVQPFPSMQGRTQVSAGGGSQPVWSRNGRELYYRTLDKIMAVDVSTASGLSAGAPRLLFRHRDGNPQGGGHTGYDVMSDGRFVMVGTSAAAEKTVTHLRIVYRP
jgi:Tol biopolymer transport system component